jgi:4-diphosphocytidyl-2-C-methyl-D-erythritol kinase
MREINLTAPAKLNLTLDILGRRPDGYHELQMVMQSVSLCDDVRVRETEGQGLSVCCDQPELPSGPENLAWRAAEAFFQAVGLRRGMEISLTKRIPAQAGLAGGSADAAAVLRGLRALLAPELPLRELERIGARVGSDVPFCVRGGTALAEGRGERLTPLPALPPCWIVLCKPSFGLSTPALFGRVRAEALERRPDLAAVRAALEAGSLEGVAARLCNVFEEVLTPDEKREIRAIRRRLESCGALGGAMSGSGPTVFGLFADAAAARGAAAALGADYSQTFLAQPLGAAV